MAQTVLTSATAYATAADLFTYCDWTIVADALRDDDGPRPGKATLLDTASDTGARLAALCLAGTGDLLAACQARGQYAPADLAALTGATLGKLKATCAGLTLARVFGRRWPATGKPDELPAVKDAKDMLERLRVGEHVFGLAENIAAGEGLGTLPLNATGYRNGVVVTEAGRFFGSRSRARD